MSDPYREAPHREAPGRFFWHELITTDPEGATDFYGAVVGWRALPVEGSGAPYWRFVPVHRGTEVQTAPPGPTGRGGLTELPTRHRSQGSPSRWHGHVWSPDAERDADRAVTLGGRRVGEARTVPSVGRVAVIQDPQGSGLTLVTPVPAARAGADPDDEPSEAELGGNSIPEDDDVTGRFTWHELAVEDPSDALRFYGEMFGWEETGSVILARGGRYRTFGSRGVELGGIHTRSDSDPAPPDWLHYLLVGNLEESLRRVGKAGGEVVHGPSEAPHGRIAHCRDPQGARFALREKPKDRPSP